MSGRVGGYIPGRVGWRYISERVVMRYVRERVVDDIYT